MFRKFYVQIKLQGDYIFLLAIILIYNSKIIFHEVLWKISEKEVYYEAFWFEKTKNLTKCLPIQKEAFQVLLTAVQSTIKCGTFLPT